MGHHFYSFVAFVSNKYIIVLITNFPQICVGLWKMSLHIRCSNYLHNDFKMMYYKDCSIIMIYIVLGYNNYNLCNKIVG